MDCESIFSHEIHKKADIVSNKDKNTEAFNTTLVNLLKENNHSDMTCLLSSSDKNAYMKSTKKECF